MSRAVVIALSAITVASAAARLGVWLVVIGAASAGAALLVARWEWLQWRPVAIALWSVNGEALECRRVGQLAVLSFGDRRALAAASTVVGEGVAGLLLAAGRQLDLVGAPRRRQNGWPTVAAWWVAAVVGIAILAATGSEAWLVVAVVASTWAPVALSRFWSSRRLTEQLAQLAEQPTYAALPPRPDLVVRDLLANSASPAAVLARTVRVLERADLPLHDRRQAWRRLDGVGVGKGRARGVALGALLVAAGAVAPWVLW